MNGDLGRLHDDFGEHLVQFGKARLQIPAQGGSLSQSCPFKGFHGSAESLLQRRADFRSLRHAFFDRKNAGGPQNIGSIHVEPSPRGLGDLSERGDISPRQIKIHFHLFLHAP